MNGLNVGGMKGLATHCDALNELTFFPRLVRIDYEETSVPFISLVCK